jgi:glycosyltransferase involved in cell wall biosynthesis
MRILFIWNATPALHTGTYHRLRHLLKAVASVGEVTIVCPIQEGNSNPEAKELGLMCDRVFTFPEESLESQRSLRFPRLVSWAKHKLRFLHPWNSALIQGNRSNFANSLVAALCAEQFDLIWAQRISCIQMLPPGMKTRVIVDLDDLEHRSLAGKLRHAPKIHHMTALYWLEFLKLRRFERSLHKLPYEFCVCSETDRQLLPPETKTWVIPNGIDIPVRAAAPQTTIRKPSLVFVGTMSYAPNVDAVLCFVREVLPLIREKVPKVQFLIVGRDPTSAVKDLHDGISVIVTGTVPDVSEFLFAATAFVAPIRFGGGTRIKILEAMAYAKAIVSTGIGAEGLQVRSGQHLLIADAPKDFASACVRVLEDESLRERLGGEGFQLARDLYQWEEIEKVVRNVVKGEQAALPDSFGIKTEMLVNSQVSVRTQK